MSEKIVYLNGAFVPESAAKISVLDSGFTAGDGVERQRILETWRSKNALKRFPVGIGAA